MRTLLASGLAAFLLLPLLAAPAGAHTVECTATDAACVADCLAGHDDLGVHSCTIYWPFAGAAAADALCTGDPALVQMCWTGTDPGCFHFVVLGERSPLLDFCY